MAVLWGFEGYGRYIPFLGWDRVEMLYGTYLLLR